MPTIEEMVETACKASFESDGSGDCWAAYAKEFPGGAETYRVEMRAAVNAVIEKHVGPMLVEAYLKGSTATAESMTLTALGRPQTPIETSKEYSARIISQMKGTKNDG